MNTCVYVRGRCGPPPWVTKGRRRARYCLHVSVARRVSLSALPHGVRQCTRVRPYDVTGRWAPGQAASCCSRLDILQGVPPAHHLTHPEDGKENNPVGLHEPRDDLVKLIKSRTRFSLRSEALRRRRRLLLKFLPATSVPLEIRVAAGVPRAPSRFLFLITLMLTLLATQNSSSAEFRTSRGTSVPSHGCSVTSVEDALANRQPNP